jgi:hypothetical protein
VRRVSLILTRHCEGLVPPLPSLLVVGTIDAVHALGDLQCTRRTRSIVTSWSWAARSTRGTVGRTRDVGANDCNGRVQVQWRRVWCQECVWSMVGRLSCAHTPLIAPSFAVAGTGQPNRIESNRIESSPSKSSSAGGATSIHSSECITYHSRPPVIHRDVYRQGSYDVADVVDRERPVRRR